MDAEFLVSFRATDLIWNPCASSCKEIPLVPEYEELTFDGSVIRHGFKVELTL